MKTSTRALFILGLWAFLPGRVLGDPPARTNDPAALIAEFRRLLEAKNTKLARQYLEMLNRELGATPDLIRIAEPPSLPTAGGERFEGRVYINPSAPNHATMHDQIDTLIHELDHHFQRNTRFGPGTGSQQYMASELSAFSRQQSLRQHLGLQVSAAQQSHVLHQIESALQTQREGALGITRALDLSRDKELIFRDGVQIREIHLRRRPPEGPAQLEQLLEDLNNLQTTKGPTKVPTKVPMKVPLKVPLIVPQEVSAAMKALQAIGSGAKTIGKVAGKVGKVAGPAGIIVDGFTNKDPLATGMYGDEYNEMRDLLRNGGGLDYSRYNKKVEHNTGCNFICGSVQVRAQPAGHAGPETDAYTPSQWSSVRCPAECPCGITTSLFGPPIMTCRPR